jgi:thiamine pyrophosphate-dependent acetolactate synthase large subunit-like protein
MFAPLVKITVKPRLGNAASAIKRARSAVLAFPPGPVHIDLSTDFTSAGAHWELSSRAMGRVDWPSVASGLVLLGLEANSEASLKDALRDTLDHKGPALIAAKVASARTRI